MMEDTDTKHAVVIELIPKHNMKSGPDIKQEHDDVEEYSTDYKGSCLSMKEAIDISSYEVGHVNEYNSQVKNEVGFDNDHRRCDLKQEVVECYSKQNDVIEVDGYPEDNKEKVELDDSKEFKVDILEQGVSNDISNTEEVINSSLSKIDFTCEHNLQVNREHGVANPKKYQCQFCEIKCKSKHSPRENIRYKIENINWYKCNVCNYKSAYKYELTMHFKQKHDVNPEIYQCKFCECKYKSKNSLIKHTRYKHNENIDWYQCNMCNYKTKYKYHLTVHFRRKHDENPEIYQCEFCECKYKIKGSLRQHIRYKHNENISWFQCNACNFKTKYKQDLVSHFERKHAGNPEMHHCQFCGSKFKYKGSLKIHIYWKHNKNVK